MILTLYHLNSKWEGYIVSESLFFYYSQPLLFLTRGPNEAAKEIKQFAVDRRQKLDFFSNWDVKVCWNI